jgi:hypothetical protein|nr:MAG TPA: hypothetical protein [Caudoviricetes sp.]
MIKFEFNYDGSELISKGEATLLQVAQDICNKAEVELGSTSFLNSDKKVSVYDNTVTAREYISYIAESAGCFACIDREGKLCFREFGQDETELPLEMFGEYKWGEEFKISKVSYEDGVRSFKFGDDTRNNLWINQENMYIVDEEQVQKIYGKIKGLTANSFECKTVIDPAIDIGDNMIIDGKNVIYQGEMELEGRFIAQISSKIQIKQKQETTTKTQSQKVVNRRVQSRIDQAEGKIIQLIEEQTEFSKKLTKREQDVDKIQEEVSRIYDFSKKVTGKNELLLEDALPTNILKFEAKAKTTKGIYPKSSLFPSLKLFPKKGGTTITVVIGRTSRTVIPKPILPSSTLFPSLQLFPRANGYYKKEYSFYISKPLREFDDINDKFVIEVDKNKGICIAKVLRYIDYQNGITTIYNEPKEEIVKELQVELFKGNNYIYIKEFKDWEMTVEYIFNNELNKEYAPRVETNSKMKLLSDEINLEVSKKVGQDEVISAINLSPEQIKILAKNLQLEGFTSVNGGFSIDEKGNASIANKTVIIDDKGITLADGASLIGGKGLLSNLQFQGLNYSFGDYTIQGTFGYIGYWIADYGDNIQAIKSNTIIVADIPENFTIERAIVTLIHRPIVASYQKTENSSETVEIIGTSRNIGLYKGDLSNYTGRDTTYANFTENDLDSYIEIQGAFGENGWTPSVANSRQNTKIETMHSIDISSELKSGEVNKLKIETRNNPPSTTSDYYSSEVKIAPYSGTVLALLNVYGFMSI